MHSVVLEFVPDCRSLTCKKSIGQMTCFDRRGSKQTSIKGGTELSERHINVEDVSQAPRTQGSNKRETDGKQFMANTDWKPPE